MANASLEDLKIDRSHSGGARGRLWAWLFGLVLVAGVAAGVWWWMARPQAAEVRAVQVRDAVGAAEPDAILNASGYVTARRRATVSAKITGKVVEVLIEEGMAVRVGQLLARLDDASSRSVLRLAEAELAAARSALAETEVRLKEARLNLDRTRRLVDEGVMGAANLDPAEAEVDSRIARLALQREEVAVAEQQVALRRTELADTEIRAPFSGIAISKDAQPGEMVSPVSAGGGFTRTGIGTIVDMSSLEIEVEVNEAYINRVKPGQRVQATLDAYLDWKIPANVITIVPAADRQKATVMVRIGFEALDPRILPDMGVKVAFLEAGATERKSDAPRLLVPKAAVRDEAGQTIVYVIKADAAERRAIRVGGEEGDHVEVEAGLVAGEHVVVEGPPDLANGDRVVTR
jgi:RND family efflux transporter MFP subunit